jgi:hypothetical protein
MADAAHHGTVPDRLADVPDLISTLLGCLVRDAPSEAHATALATCAKAWLTTEDLLRDTVGAEAPAVWAWLRQRPFVAYGARGVFPHDLVRDVLDAEFERRSPEQYRRLHRIIHDHVVDGVRAASGPDRQVLAQHLLFLHRRSPLTSVFFTLRTRGSAALVPGRADEHPAVLSTLERFHGAATVAAARDWLAEQPGQLSVVRTEEGLAGFAFHALCADSAMAQRDPVTRAVLAHVAAHGPTRAGEQVDVARFLAGTRGNERDPYAVLAGSVSSIIEWVSRPLAWSFILTTDPEFWGPFFDYLTFPPVFEVDAYGVHHVAFAHDWRRLPVDPWLNLMNEREHSGGTGPPPAELLRPPPIGRADFAVAIRQALADLRRPDGLAGSRLIGTALADDPARLRAVLRAGVRELATRPRGGPPAAVLNRTFVHAAPTQEAAAEVLGLPFSTYRRHLAKAVEQLTELLWAVEIGAVRLRVDGD